jgi:transposase
MRKGFNGLFGLVRDRLQCEPLSGHVFLFCNGQRNRLKLVFWDGSGLWVCAKRLEKGQFRWPEVSGDQNKVQLSQGERVLLLGGIDLRQAERRPCYRREVLKTTTCVVLNFWSAVEYDCIVVIIVLFSKLS